MIEIIVSLELKYLIIKNYKILLQILNRLICFSNLKEIFLFNIKINNKINIKIFIKNKITLI